MRKSLDITWKFFWHKTELRVATRINGVYAGSSILFDRTKVDNGGWGFKNTGFVAPSWIGYVDDPVAEQLVKLCYNAIVKDARKYMVKEML